MLTKKKCKEALEVSRFLEVVIRGEKGNFEYYSDFKDTVTFVLLEQLINEHFDLQLTSIECDLIILSLNPLEEELGMDVTLLINKVRKLQSKLPKQEGVVECVEID